MIIINNLEDLEKYKTKVIPKHRREPKRVVMYEFKENGKLADVTFNCEIPLGICDLVESKNIGKKEIVLNPQFSMIDLYEFKAKEIFANKKLRIGSLKADRFIFNEDCKVEEILKIKNKIQGTNLDCEFMQIQCKEIICNTLIVDNVRCAKLQAQTLITKNYYAENVVAENVNYYKEINN